MADHLHLQGFSDLARDHALNPRHHGALREFDGHSRITGSCGDTMEFWLRIHDGRVAAVSFVTDGCGSSRACGSMAATLAEGKRIEVAATLKGEDVLNALGGLPAEHEHCSLLAARALTAACDDYLRRHGGALQGVHGTNAASGAGADNRSAAFHQKMNRPPPDPKDQRMLQARLSHIRHKIVVLSGKGGVGKSTVAVNLATALVHSGKRVGLLDVDIHGPSIPTMLNLEGRPIHGGEDGLQPVEVGAMKVMSLGFLLRHQDDAVIWRGPRKMGVIRQFLQDVAWGDLDVLVIDSPPGTGDEPLSVCQLIGELDGAVIVTTPQKVAARDVRKSITFCQELHVPVLGVVENMSGFVCPKCGAVTHIFPQGAGKRIAGDMHVPFLGSLPLDPGIAAACDSGRAFLDYCSTSATAALMRKIIEPIVALDETPQAVHHGGSLDVS